MSDTMEGLREAVLTDARAQAHSIVQEALAEAERIGLQTDEEMDVRHKAITADAELAARREAREIVAEADAELQRQRLEFTETLIAGVLDAVRGRLREIASDGSIGPQILHDLAIEGAEAVSSDAVTLFVRDDDRARMNDAALESIAQATGKRVSLADESVDVIGGVVVQSADGRERYDNSLDSRMERRLPETRALIQTRVSHAG